VIQLFPFATWIALVTSAVLLIVLWTLGELRPRGGSTLLGWFVAAAYCQFFARSVGVAAMGLALQTMLAIYLLLRWKLTV
jgi:hypothetical protein